MSATPLDHLVVARGDRVRLRHKHRGDALNDFLWRRDPEIARFDGALPLAKSFSEFLEYFERTLLFRDPERSMLAIETPRGEQIGNIMFYNGDGSRHSAELGVCIALAGSRGQGLGTEAVIAFLSYVWNELPFRVIYLHTLEWNERAINCFEKAGFHKTARVLRKRQWFIRMEVRREWWLLWEQEGRFSRPLQAAGTPAPASPALAGQD